MLPPTHYLQLPAPASTSSGSQQLRLCDQGVYKSDTAVKEVEPLADVGPWLYKESPFATASSSEQVCAASAHRTLHRYSFSYSRPTVVTLASALAHLCTHL